MFIVDLQSTMNAIARHGQLNAGQALECSGLFYDLRNFEKKPVAKSKGFRALRVRKAEGRPSRCEAPAGAKPAGRQCEAR